jgi:hypothetical protein
MNKTQMKTQLYDPKTKTTKRARQNIEMKHNEINLRNVLETSDDPCAIPSKNLERLMHKWDRMGQETPRPWCGWLRKCNHLVSWQPHWFHLQDLDPTIDGLRSQCAVLMYHSDAKGERRLFVEDIRREPWMDSGDSVAFSVRIIPTQTTCTSSRSGGDGWLRRTAGGRRLHLRAASAVEAACFLICLLRILSPNRTLPTMLDAAKTPSRLLRTLL